MANVTEFFIKVAAPDSSLRQLKAFLLLAVETCPGGFYGECILNCEALFPDLDKRSEHSFIGLGSWHDDGRGDVIEDGCFRFTTDGKLGRLSR